MDVINQGQSQGQNLEPKVRDMLGNLMMQIAALQAELESAYKLIGELRVQLAEKNNENKSIVQ